MTELLPIATYHLNVEPYSPTPAIDVTMPVTIRLTMAALNPEAYDDEKKPSTLRIVKRNPDFDDDEDDILNGDYDEDEMDEDEDAQDVDEEEEKPKKKGSKKESKAAAAAAAAEEEDDDDEEVDEEDVEAEDEDDEFEEFVLLTLSPKTQFQQSIDITIAPEEDIQFVVTGSYSISLSGNYIQHPFDTPIADTDDEDEEDEEEYDSDEYDLTPDEDEIIDDELDDLEDASDVENKIEELIQEAEQRKKDKKSNKRKQEDKEEEEEEEEKVEPENKKKSKKEVKESKKAKKVEFKKDLEEGPTKKSKEPKTKILEGGIAVEDRTSGTGQQAKKGSKIGMRYIGKLKNGKVFDKNTSGKPFVFKLGHGEVIKGWDIGVAGMSVGGERRIVIPAAYAYGKQALPGIPANSELTFDVKLVSLK